MTNRSVVGDHMRWNSEAGEVQDTIFTVHTKDVDYKGHTRRCSEQDPRYEINSDKTAHVAMPRAMR